MVGVTPKAGRDELSSANNPMIKYMLKVRESHAREQKKDYSHVFRSKTRCELLRLSAIAMAVEFAYAAETSFVSPILLRIGINHRHMSMAWGLSPLLGFFISPLLGSVSDRCKITWGRRRPFITLLSIGIVAGLILVPYGKDIGMLLGDVGYNVTDDLFNSSSTDVDIAALMAPDINDEDGPILGNFKFAAIFTIIGMVLLDLDADTLQTPARTYLLDMTTPEDQPRALTTFTLMAGFGGTIGYALGGIDWENTQIGAALGGNIPTVFGMVTIIFIFCYFVTVTTFREIPLTLMESDELLKPLSAEAIKKEIGKKNKTVYYIKETTSLELQMAASDMDDIKKEDVKLESYQNGDVLAAKKLPEENGNVELGIDGNDDSGIVSMRQYLRSIFVMPYSIRMLSLTNLLCWMGHVTYCLYFTDFVGEAVFGGDPTAPLNSEDADLYEAGVRFGCWGMSIYALSCSVYSLGVTKLMRIVGIKVVYIAGIVYYAIGMLVLAIWPTKWGVLLFSTSAGILYGTLFTLPYMLVANYHAKNCFCVHNGESVPLKHNRGLGTDIAIISSMVFIAQFIVSLSVGPLVAWMGTVCAILYASAVLAFMAAFSALFVLYI